jgi:hypothetical protein
MRHACIHFNLVEDNCLVCNYCFFHYNKIWAVVLRKFKAGLKKLILVISQDIHFSLTHHPQKLDC